MIYYFYHIYIKGSAGFESGLVEGAGGAYGSSSYDSSSFTSGPGGFGAEAGFGGGAGGGAGGGYSASSYESSSFPTGGAGGAAGFDVAAAAFYSADKNKDGSVDPNEFKQFYQGGL